MITYLELNSKSPEFTEAYAVISMDIAPEFVEPEDFVRDRFRIQKEGPKTDDERRMIPDGFRIHMIAAKDRQTNIVVGAIYVNFIPKIGEEKVGFALVSYLAVLPEYRRHKIGVRLVEEAIKQIHADSILITGTPAVGLLFEIEDIGKEPVERLTRLMGGYPLAIDYYQPSVREGCTEQQMNLWLIPLNRPIRSHEEAKQRIYPIEFIHGMVKNLFIYEYPGPAREGFIESSKPYQALLKSLRGKTSVGFKTVGDS